MSSSVQGDLPAPLLASAEATESGSGAVRLQLLHQAEVLAAPQVTVGPAPQVTVGPACVASEILN